jgi:DNA invertase Pin-like site-specific DNA recombinase
MVKCAIYGRISTHDQHIESQLHQLRELAANRGFVVVGEYQDQGNSSPKARRPGLDAMMRDARKGRFGVILCAGFDRIARSTRHFLQTLNELDGLGVDFISAREAIDTTGPTGRLFLTLVGCLGGLDRALTRERIRQGMARRRLEGFRLGRAPLDVDRDAIARDRLSGKSLTETARAHHVSRASVVRFVRQAQQRSAPVEQFQPMSANAAVELMA